MSRSPAESNARLVGRESSAAVADVLLAGLPLIVNCHGSAAELPKDVVLGLPDAADSSDLAVTLAALMRDPARRSALGTAGRAYAKRELAPQAIAQAYFDAIEKAYASKLRFVFRSFPLAQHSHAQAAAEAAEFAADHGKFWEMHDLLFEHQRALDVQHLLGYARDLGLDADALGAALRDRTYAGIVDEVKEGGEESGIPGTPAFFLNDILFEDEPTRENLSHAIEYLLEHHSIA